MERVVEDSSAANEHSLDAPAIQLMDGANSDLKEPVGDALVCLSGLSSFLLQKIYQHQCLLSQYMVFASLVLWKGPFAYARQGRGILQIF